MKCSKCDFETESNRGMKKHITSKHFEKGDIDSEYEYYNITSKLSRNDINKIIELYKVEGLSGKDISISIDGVLNEYQVLDLLAKFNIERRSQSEAKQTKLYKAKYKNTMNDEYGVDNPSQLDSVKTKKKETFIANYGYENNFCNPIIRAKAIENNNSHSDEAKIKRLNTLISRYGVTNMSQIESVRKQNSERMKLKISKMSKLERRQFTEHARSCCTYESKPQQRVEEVLKNIKGIRYSSNTFLWSYNYDLVTDKKDIIEVQGEYWHANPNTYKPNDIMFGGKLAKELWDKDERKRVIAEENGYNLIYLWENDINSMSDVDIREFLIKHMR